MKTFLFPSKVKLPALVIYILASLVGIFKLIFDFEVPFLEDVKVFAIMDDFPLGDSIYFGWTTTDLLDEVLTILIVISGLLVAFAKVSNEDEFIAKMRLDSLILSMYFNYAVLLFSVLFFYTFGFMFVLIFNMFTLLLFFIIRFNWVLYLSKRRLENEE